MPLPLLLFLLFHLDFLSDDPLEVIRLLVVGKVQSSPAIVRCKDVVELLGRLILERVVQLLLPDHLVFHDIIDPNVV